MGMTRNRTRVRRPSALRLWLERALPALVVCLLLLGGGLMMTGSGEGMIESCAASYARARSTADTLAVDRQRVAGGRGLPGRTSCGRLRREGFLDRHRGGIDHRGEGGAAAGDPLIEK